MRFADLPKPGVPDVQILESGLSQWTFASDDPATQRAEFEYWRGWFGLEEDDEPYAIAERTWQVRRQRQPPQHT